MRRWVAPVLIILAGLQFFRPGIPARPAPAEVQVPPPVRQILRRSCYSCHSDERRLSWFDEIVPGYWLVRHDVIAARERLNFSSLSAQPAAAQKAALYEAVNMIRLGAMPLPRFRYFHPEARVTPDDVATLEAYLAPPSAGSTMADSRSRNSPETTPQGGVLPNKPVAPVSLESVSPEFNRVVLDAAFERWRVISFTDRTDNDTLRFVLGNDIALQAAKLGNISPWPDGTRFAKVAWQQQVGPDGLIHPGSFIQVETMTKNSRDYRQTDGWGWGRWRGTGLKPYGRDEGFVDECIGCHRPLHGNDYVYTLPVTLAQVRGDEVVNNRAAVIPAAPPWRPLTWRPITMYVDRRNDGVAVLFGNDAAIQIINPRTASSQAARYPPGSVLALATWAEREDPHWFGARIPDVPRSLEFVQVTGNPENNIYRRFAGAGLKEDHVDPAFAAERMKSILALTPAEMP